MNSCQSLLLKIPKIQPVISRTHVKALKFVSDFLLIGEANRIHCYDLERRIPVQTETVFCGTTSVHGIRILCEKEDGIIIAVFGGKSIRMYIFYPSLISDRFSPVTSEHHFEDWIHDVGYLHSNGSNLLSVIMAHNQVVLWNWQSYKIFHRYYCSEQCILYSAHVIQCHPEASIFASGTVFKEIVIWSLQTGENDCDKRHEPFHRLTGHKGVVFSITFSMTQKILCSTSDDRTLRLWKFSPHKAVAELEFLPLEAWIHGTFKFINVLYTHEARVWSSVILPNSIISIGEDSSVCFHSIDGMFTQREKCHREGSIWCIDVNSKSSVAATGGSDSGVMLWDISKRVAPPKSEALKLPSQDDNQDFPRTVSLLLKNNQHYVVVSTEKGWLLVYDLQGEEWIFEHVNSVFAAYSILSASPSGTIILWGNLFGELSVFRFWERDLSHIKNQKVLDGKICGLHWADEDSKLLLVCGLDGLMMLWFIQPDSDDDMVLKCKLHLPRNKHHWWSTVAACWGSALVVGDRAGSIHIYNVDAPDNQQSDTVMNPTISYTNIHGKNGVTDVKGNGSFLYSTGKDGKLVHYHADESGIRKLHHIKVPNCMEWLGKLMVIEDDLILLGFHSTEFIAWSSKHSCSLMKVTCGGGHRSWDFSINSSNLSAFVAIKQKVIYVSKEKMDFKIKKSTLQYGTSGMSFRCVHHMLTRNDGIGDVSILACGGEEPTLKIVELRHDCKLPSSVSLLQSISGHLSNIRSIAKCEIVTEKSWLLVSVGGRAQMIAWRVHYHNGFACEHLATDFLWNVDMPLRKPWREKCEVISDPQTRYMDVSVWHNSSCSSSSGFYIASACSDSYFRIHSFDVMTSKFSLCTTVQNGQNCVLKMSMFCNTNQDKLFLATGSTDGFLKIYGLPLEASDQADHPSSLFLQDAIHQSGINALDVKQMKENLWLLCSGGDDNSICMMLLRLDSSANTLETVAAGAWKQAHASQITGVHILNGNYFISVSIDQRLNLCSWNQNGANLDIQLIDTKICHIADVSNSEAWFNKMSEEWTVVVCGEGLGVLQISLPSTNS